MDMCARCRVKPMMSAWTGCLCADCEDATIDMTQAELDADYEIHGHAHDVGGAHE